MDKNNIAIPVSIIIAGILIAGAVYFGGTKPNGANNAGANNNPKKVADAKAPSKDDHIIGNPDAKVIIVEYSDLQCPFCQKFHESMKTLMDTYGKEGKVAWVYRHFPLNQIHPLAQKAAEGSECAAELGGNTKFWEFVDNILANSTTLTDKLKDLPAIAKEVGLDVTKFNECLNSGKYAKKVADSLSEGTKAGVTGTPSSFVFVKGKLVDTIPGVAPVESLKATVDAVLAK